MARELVRLIGKTFYRVEHFACKTAADKSRLFHHLKDSTFSLQNIRISEECAVQSIQARSLDQLIPEIRNAILLLCVLIEAGLYEVVPLTFADHHTIDVSIALWSDDVSLVDFVIVQKVMTKQILFAAI